ncbi:hypothetical protein [Halomonas denitrificans]|nr:hypothetical protein [Halomonas denitrificans]
MAERRASGSLRAAWALVLVGSIALAETPDPPVPLFDASRLDAEPLPLEIRAPWRRLRREREEQGPYDAELRLPGLEGPLALTVERRGISRQEICAMPPVRLRFDETQIDGTLFAGNRTIKVVTHCHRSERWAQYVVLEFLAYRFYSALTDLSFRVRSAEIVYVDVERERSEGPHVAFLIEDDRLVGNRHGLDKLDVKEIRPSDLPAFETSVFMLFQFMIGNVDFSPLGGVGDECCHNVKLIGSEQTLHPVYAVPYDFDSSGWVDTRYAAAPEQLPIEDVRQRLFRGFCRHNEGLAAARERFQSRRAQLYRILSSETRLTSRSQRKAERYLDDFFEVLDSDRRFDRMITGACRS